MTDETTEQIDEAAEQIEEAQENVSRSMQWYARVYVVALFGLIVAAIVATFGLGIVPLSEVVSADAINLGWLVEYLAIFLVALFMFFSLSMTIIALPVGFTSGFISAVARIADAYQLPEE